MTENEKIAKTIEVFEEPSKHIKCVHKCENGVGFLKYSQYLVMAFETAIDGLKELQQYRSIGTVSECREAMEKQRAKKSKHDGCFDNEGIWHERNGVNGKPYELCPNCGTNLCCEMPNDRKPHYCEKCGQKLKLN